VLCKPFYKHLSVALFVGFTASYVAVYLSEVLATFLTTLAILIFLSPSASDLDLTRAMSDSDLLRSVRTWFLGELVFGLCMFACPETPLILVAVFLIYALRWWRILNWGKLGAAGLWVALNVLLPLAPWAARNVLIFGRGRFLSPRYAETFGDVMPTAFYAWTMRQSDMSITSECVVTREEPVFGVCSTLETGCY
jgi:hypothetical protein